MDYTDIVVIGQPSVELVTTKPLVELVSERAPSIELVATEVPVIEVVAAQKPVLEVIAGPRTPDWIHRVTVSNTAPTSPSIGDLWIDTK
jgi:hypothetical protein